MRAGDGVADIGVVAGDGLLDWPCLPSQGARVGPGVVGVDAAQAPRLATLGCDLRPAPCLLSTGGSFALTKTSLRLGGLR